MTRSATKLRLLTLDATNTFLAFRRPIGKQYAEVAKTYGVDVDPAAVQHNFRATYKEMDLKFPNFGRGIMSWQAWWVQLVTSTLKSSGAPSDVNEKLLSAIGYHLIKLYSTGEPWCVVDGVSSILSEVRRKGVVIGCISNFDPRLSSILTFLGMRPYFNFVLTSYDVGVPKPDKKVFQTALDKASVREILPQDALHVGDDVEKDYEGARGAGWNAMLFVKDAVKSPELTVAVDPAHVAHNMEELRTKLRTWLV